MLSCCTCTFTPNNRRHARLKCFKQSKHTQQEGLPWGTFIQTVDNIIHWINCHSMDRVVCFVNTAVLIHLMAICMVEYHYPPFLNNWVLEAWKIKNSLSLFPFHSWGCTSGYMYECFSWESLVRLFLLCFVLYAFTIVDHVHIPLDITNTIMTIVELYFSAVQVMETFFLAQGIHWKHDELCGYTLYNYGYSDSKRNHSSSTLNVTTTMYTYISFNRRKKHFWAKKNYKWAYVELRIKKWKNRFLYRNYLFSV